MTGSHHTPQTAAIALGSNLTSAIGPPEASLRTAIEHIAALGRVIAVSSFYETAPVGFTQQPDFINAALLLQTEHAPVDLMRKLLSIEQTMGRDRSQTQNKGPRIIDLDLLLVGELMIETPELTLPHPAMTERRFVLQPMAEIAPFMRHPIEGCTVAELLTRLH